MPKPATGLETIVEPAAEFVLSGEVDRISGLPPFDAVQQQRLRQLLVGCHMVFFRRGSTVHHPEIALASPCFWIVRQGRVRATELDRTLAPMTADETFEVGGLFPAGAMLTQAAGTRVYTAVDDCYLWKVEGDGIDRWLAEPGVLRWIGLRLGDELSRLREAAADLARARQHADQALAMPARSIGTAAIACVAPDRSIGEVASLMSERGIGSVLVGVPEAVEGIVTQTDLIARGLALRVSPDTPVSRIMTREPRTIDDDASVLEAGIEMAQSRFRHLLLRGSEGPVVGLVSERDIFRAQQHGITHVFRPIDEADSVAELVDLAGRVREFGERVFRQGMEVGQFTRLVSSMNDRISGRLLTVLGRNRHLDADYCWLAFGSEAREEQGFVTDQDNGIAFVSPASADPARVRSELLEFAKEVNDGLDECGFARCKGNIMASNPELCLTLDEWKRKLVSLIRTTTPKSLLNATIFFDLRAVHGNPQLAEAMLEHLLGESAGNTIFLHQMAVNALAIAPPLGRFSQFSTDSGPHRGTVDLKTQGSRLFVDIARIYALANGVRSANTVERLRVVGQRIRRSLSAIEGDIAAFRFIQTVRLRRQLDSIGDGGDPNRIEPYALDELQQRILRESLRQAESLQARLKLDFCP